MIEVSRVRPWEAEDHPQNGDRPSHFTENYSSSLTETNSSYKMSEFLYVTYVNAFFGALENRFFLVEFV